jgi:hypothetical protein
MSAGRRIQTISKGVPLAEQDNHDVYERALLGRARPLLLGRSYGVVGFLPRGVGGVCSKRRRPCSICSACSSLSGSR